VNKYYLKNKIRILKQVRENHYSQNNRCSCGKLILNKSIRCKSCAKKGELNNEFINGNTLQTKCVCGKEKDYRAKICVDCYIKFNKGKNHGSFLDGRTLEKYQCKNCKKEISWQSAIYGGGRCRSCAMKGENSFNWIEDRNLLDYPDEFSAELKEQIRKRDNHICQNCGMTEEEHLIVIGQILSVHHIDYDKKNCNKKNLITVCMSCNIRANYNRNYWQDIYINKIKDIYENRKVI